MKGIAVRIAVVGFLLIAQPGILRAQDQSSPYDPREVALMPRYCKYTQSYRTEIEGAYNPKEIAYWDRVMGPSNLPNRPMFENMHHYCNAIWKTNRALLTRLSPSDRATVLKSSIPEFDYVILRAPDSFVLLPEILTKKGENLARLGAREQAKAAFNRAISLKPDYWPPYAGLADFYRQIGDTGAARDVLEKGLAAVPGAKALKRRLSELQTSRK